MNTLTTVEEAAKLIQAEKQPMVVAGSEALLRRLPRGNWIGATIPYFMGPDGGVMTHERVSVDVMPGVVLGGSIRTYQVGELGHLPADARGLESGCTIILAPFMSEVTAVIARDSQTWPGVFDRPLMGWIAGCELKDMHTTQALVFDGTTGTAFADRAVVLNLTLAPKVRAEVDIVNIFEFGDGDPFEFVDPVGYTAKHILVRGERRVLGEYLKAQKVDTSVPLIADFSGARMNVALTKLDEDGTGTFGAPVFQGIVYRFARPLTDYALAHRTAVEREVKQADYVCNCALNYALGGLEGKQVGSLRGPFTFGEIAYLLLNQTLVYLKFVKTGA